MSQFRQTLLNLPDDSNMRTVDVTRNEGNDHEYILTTAAVADYESSKGDVQRSKLVLPIMTSESSDTLNRGNSNPSKTIDEYIAEGLFPSLLLVNETLRETRPITLLHDEQEEISTFDQESTLQTSPKVLYVAQGEMAHCTPFQSDIIVSDRATTCHILALRSSYRYSDYTEPSKAALDNTTKSMKSELCTMTHLDSCYYEQCIRDAFRTHSSYYSSSRCCDSQTEKANITEPYIALDIHIIGGFRDRDGTSQMMTIWIMELLADLADEYYHRRKPRMEMTLQTACITAANHDMNHKNNGGPVLRGLALDCHTGKVFAAHCIHPAPAITLRMSTTWIRSHHPNNCDPISSSTLSIIHTYHDNVVIVRKLFPNNMAKKCACGFIEYQMQQQFALLLQIKDDNTLLKYCSTSPEHEENDFCSSARTSFRYILEQYSAPITERFEQPMLRFQRDGINKWKLV